MSVILEKQLLSHILYNPEVIEKTTLTSEDFSDVIVRCVYSKLKEKHQETNGYEFINKDILPLIYENNKQIFEMKGIETFREVPKYILSDYDRERSFDWMFSENIIREEKKKRNYTEVLEKALEDISDNNLDTTLSNLDMGLRNLEKENPRDSKIIKSNTFLDIYDERSKEIEELKKSNKPTYYTFHHPVLKNYIRMKKNWTWNIVAKSGHGKTIIAADLMLNLVKDYNERGLFLTDENSDEVILTYLHCNYFNVKYKDVEDRVVNLSEIINNLSVEDKKEYDRIFGLLDVIELSCIPIVEVRKILRNAKNNDNPYSFLFLDSFDEINSDASIEEVTRYDLNAKEVERLPKEFDCIVGVSNQLMTTLYEHSIEKIPILNTHQSKTINKKVSCSLLIGEEYKKDENGQNESLGTRIKISKSRSGGMGIIYPFTRDFDRCKIIPSDNEVGNNDNNDMGF